MEGDSTAPVAPDDCPFVGWSMYFPTVEYQPGGGPAELAKLFYDYYENCANTIFKEPSFQRTVCADSSVRVDFTELCESMDQSFVPALQEHPELVLGAMGVALHQRMTEIFQDDVRFDRQRKLNPRLHGHKPISKLKNIKSNFIGKFVSVVGTVVRVSNIKPQLTRLDFRCARCEAVMTVHFVDGKYSVPERCAMAQCRGRTFVPDRQSAVTIDWQRIRLQEHVTDDRESGRVPRTVECELTDELVDRCVPGDVVTLSGTVKVLSVDTDRGTRMSRGASTASGKSLFYVYIDANSVQNNKHVESGKDGDAMFLDRRELQWISGLATWPDLFRTIVHTICPGIYGHEVVKAGLALALFGGVQKFGAQQDRIAVRGDPHVLIVGDPGMGKSQMLKSVTDIAPRGVYVCGSYSSTSGLTVTLLKEAGSGDHTLEAGALVLGDQGVCCIDEFDKMGHEHQALLEAMEQQSISIAKAGIVCTLPARTSVVAAANPVGGHYNKGKTVAENLKLSAPVLSRFDLVFIMIDRPNDELDRMLSEHIVGMHAGSKRKHPPVPVQADDLEAFTQRQQQQQQQQQQQLPTQSSSQLGTEEGRPLGDRLRRRAEEALDPIPTAVFRKFISYARRFVQPVLSDDARRILQEFYLRLRAQSTTVNSGPITTRQLESMVRLAEARARCELREVVTAADAADVVDVMKESLLDIHETAEGFIDFDRTGVSGGKRMSQAKTFMMRLKAEAARRDSPEVWSFAELATEIKRFGFRGEPQEMIDFLNQNNFILLAGSRTYRINSG